MTIYTPLNLQQAAAAANLQPINGSPFERAFCAHAHHKIRNPGSLAARTWEQCTFIRDGCACGLCTCAPCLFVDPLAQEWITIEDSERIRAELHAEAIQ